MIFDTKTKFYQTLTAIPGIPQVVFGWPETFEVMPLVSYQEVGQYVAEWFDNAPLVIDSTMEVHVWTDSGSTTTATMSAISNALTGALWTLTFSADAPEPDTRIRHRVMRFSRRFSAEELV